MVVIVISLQLSVQRGFQPGKAVHEYKMSSLVRQNSDVPLSQGAHSESKYGPAATLLPLRSFIFSKGR